MQQESSQLSFPGQSLGVRFRVIGLPGTQAGSRAVPTVNGTRLISTGSKNLAEWRTDVSRQASLLTSGPPMDCPLFASLVFYLHRPRRPRWGHYPASRPDIDKLVRAVFDSLTNAAVWADDSRVTDLDVKKRYESDSEPPGVDVAIYMLT